jgi:dihydrofolate reductase
MNVSLDGYVEDVNGSIEFTSPAVDVFSLAIEHVRQASAFLFGRRLYEVMEEPWTTAAQQDDLPPLEMEFAQLYAQTPRIVFSDTLESVPDGLRLVRSKDAVAEVRRLKEEPHGFLQLGGPGLAASLVDLIDEFRLFVTPVVLGGGKPFFPTGKRLNLRMVEHRALDSGVVYVRYERVR